MTSEKKEGHSSDRGSCANHNSPNLWIIGLVGVGLVSFFCYALFNKQENIPSVQDLAQDVMVMGQQAAYIPPGCATCPTVTNCFPGAAGSGQQIALMNPNCATCPNVAQCFPQGLPNPAQQAAFNPRGNGRMMWSNVQSVAQRTPMAVPIFRDALMPHQFRGVCERCHVVKPDIAISINAPLPHDYRGVCSNCHLIQGPNQGVR